MPRMLVFTDLDGTLLDPVTYEPGPALEAAKTLRESGVPVVFCSSKTCAEQETIRATFGLEDPFIVENGSAIVFETLPGGCDARLLDPLRGRRARMLGRRREEILQCLQSLRTKLGMRFRGYAEMSVEEIAAKTGLSLEAAKRAATRDFSETLVDGLPEGHERTVLANALTASRLTMVCGGRFWTVTGEGADKGNAVRSLTAMQPFSGKDRVTIGIGDSANDRAMLEACDFRFVVQRPDGSWHDYPGVQNVTRIEGIGPHGWVRVAERVLYGKLAS